MTAAEVRYFHAADRAAAAAVGYLAGVPVADYTSFRPTPPPGRLELLLPPPMGAAQAPPPASSTTMSAAPPAAPVSIGTAPRPGR